MEILLQSDTMQLEKEGKRAWVTFIRESHLNAVNNEGTVLLNRIARAIGEDPDIRVVVIRGRGRAFCTGIDLKQLAADEIDMSYHERWEKALRLFEQMEKIVIVGMHGYCLGGGLQLALAGDIRVCTPGCQIGLPAIRESLIPGLSTWRLPRYIGWGRAKKLIIGGENISGEEASTIGLVDHLIPEEDFFSHLDRVAADYLKSCSAGSRMSKLLTNQAFDKGYGEFLTLYFNLQERTQYSLDAEESKKAYRERREPCWQ
ncbi:MAG: enoyl-CoA hydratase/isomerase family protein [Desulfobacterales bacterium]